MKVLIDMDGVVADFVAGCMRLHQRDWPYHRRENLGDVGWGLEKLWGLTPQQFWEPMDYDFWANLPKTAEADGVMEMLIGKCGIGNLCFLTACSLNNGCVDGKRVWVQRCFPDVPILFSCRSFHPEATGPKQFLANDDSLLVDDYSVNCDDFVEDGGLAFLFPRSWNRRYPEEPRALELLEQFLEIHC
jgi:hypothetical protein